jgi:hypothetical protein
MNTCVNSQLGLGNTTRWVRESDGGDDDDGDVAIDDEDDAQSSKIQVPSPLVWW